MQKYTKSEVEIMIRCVETAIVSMRRAAGKVINPKFAAIYEQDIGEAQLLVVKLKQEKGDG